MSVDSSQLEREKLEGKDRDELSTIVTAMGGKPGRSKKADLIDMILGLASGDGGEANGANGAKPSRGRRTKGDDGDADSAGADDHQPAAVPAAAAPAEPAAPGDQPAGAAPRRFRFVGWSGDSEGADAPAAPSDDPEAALAPTELPAGRVNTAPGDDAEGEGESGGAATSDRDGDDRRFDGEPGNRRRRRRGRDRDRRDRFDGDRGQERNQERGERDRQQFEQFDGEPVAVAGYLDLRDEGYGFLRIHGAMQSRDDAYVSVRQVRQFGLRRGDYLTGASRPAGRNEKNPALLRIDTVNNRPPDEAARRPRFEDLTPLFPDEKLRMEHSDDPGNMTARIVDLISPIGKGQRGLIVSPPKAGKTTIMKQIARSIEINNPEVVLFVLLVDERPEEVTDMRRWLLKGEVVASTFDRPADEHTHVAELTIERAKRLVEYGNDVVIILDGITRLARAYNLAAPATGRIMSGGVDSGALYPPKKFFGAARNIEEGGSLTILATALVETGSRMDEVIFEEFKGTGNMELRLDRRIAERRIYPAIDVGSSSTRHEELLFERRQLQQVYKLRRVLSGLQQDGEGGGGAALELLIDRLRTFKNNDAFLDEVAKGPSIG